MVINAVQLPKKPVKYLDFYKAMQQLSNGKSLSINI